MDTAVEQVDQKDNSQDNSYVIALVWSWLMTNPEYYMTYVPSYSQVRYIGAEKHFCVIKVGAHYRRRAEFRTLVPALSCVCKFERLAVPRGLSTPLMARKQRTDEYGHLIPLRDRQLIWL
jgi:hypothetical protein